MSMRAGMMLAGLVAAAGWSAPAKAECAKTASGAPMAMGEGKTFQKGKTAAQKRLGAERAAYLDAVKKLRACLPKEDLAKVSAVTIADIRYFDSDPVVEIDLAATVGTGPAKLVVLGSGAPKMDGENVKKVRIETERAAVTLARRNATEALNAFLPADEEAAGSARKAFDGTLTGCAATEVSYWDDGGVSAKVECSAGAKGDVKKSSAPKVQKRAAEKAAQNEPQKAAPKK